MRCTKYFVNSISPVLFISLLLLGGTFTGCGIHFHRPEDAQLAQSAVDAFKGAKLAETVTAEYASSVQILAQEIAAMRRQSNARRDQWLAAFIGGRSRKSSWGGMSKYINNRIIELAGKDANKDVIEQDLIKLLAAPNRIYETMIVVQRDFSSYHATRLKQNPIKDPRIPRIGAKFTDEQEKQLTPTGKQMYDEYKDSLKKYETALKEGAPSSALWAAAGLVDTHLR